MTKILFDFSETVGGLTERRILLCQQVIDEYVEPGKARCFTVIDDGAPYNGEKFMLMDNSKYRVCISYAGQQLLDFHADLETVRKRA